MALQSGLPGRAVWVMPAGGVLCAAGPAGGSSLCLLMLRMTGERKFDLKAYDQLLELQIENGVEAVIVGGTTGEGHLMSWDEHIMLIAHTVNAYGDA